MGPQHSSGIFHPSLGFLINCDLVSLEARILKCRIQTSSSLLTSRQIQTTMGFTDTQIYLLLKLFDYQLLNKVSSLDLFGAMALSSSDDLESKFRFLFRLMDQNRDNFLSSSDVETLFICVSRGFARLKSIHPPSPQFIHTLVSDIFTRNAFELSDSKEISFGHLKAYMAVVESTRLYFSSLGTKLAATRDIGKLMQQRTDLMREMAVLKAEIELLSNSIQDEAQDTASFLFERGGYLKYLQMSEPGSLLSSQEPDLTVYNGWIAPADVSIPSEDQVQRRNRRNKSHRKENNSDDDNMELEVRVSDATVYENGCVLLYDDGSSSTGDDDSFIESAIKKKWAALRNRRLPLGGELHLDIDLLEDLLEGAGLSISDHDAQRCLAQVPRNQANMYTCQDILKWVKTYSREKRVVHPIWTRNFCRMSGLFEAWQRCLKGIVEAIGCQTRLLRDSLSSAYYHQFIARLPATDPISLTCSCLSLSAFINVDQTGAHRQQKLAPPAIKKAFNSNTPPRANASVKEPVVSESAAKEEEEHANRRGTQSQIHISYESTSERTKSSSRSQSQIRLADANRRLVRSIKEVSAGDVLEYFNHKKKEDADCDGVPTYKTAIWLTLQAQKPSVSDYEMQVLLQTSVHFFKGIPYDYRHDFYSYVHGDIFTALPEDVLQSGGNTNSQKVVIIALLGVEDIFENMEKRFPNEVLFTRMIRSLEFTIACQSTLQELYQASSAYSACRSRLFGPQEDELGEEGMNPLVFARQCRLQKKAIEEQLSSLRGWDLDTLKSHLSSHGYSSSGTIGEIKDRAQVVLTRQMERVGSGEISLFGRRICTRVFHKYDADGDGELSVHEINCLLSDLEVGTLYDLQEYKLISAKFGLLTGEKGGLTLPAFVAYTEIHGYLLDMIERLGIGSFDDIVKGRVSGKIEVLDGAMNSLYSLCEGPTFAQRFLKQILFVLSDLRDGKINLKLKQCSDVFSFLSSHLLSSSIFSNLEAGQKAFHSTGWFARWVHSIQEWLADGERGFLREIRRYNMEALKSYYSFGDSLKRLCSELNAAPKSELDKTAFEKGLNSILPPVLDTTNTSYKIKSIDAQIAALKYELLTGLTDQERERVQKSINNKERDIADLLSTAQKAIHLLGCHVMALYDVVRWLEVFTPFLGMGTAEVNLRIGLKGLQFAQFLPPAMGEPTIVKQAMQEKIERTERRRQEAFAALERERLRRELTDDERERLRLEKIAEMIRERDMQERALLDAAYIALVECREKGPLALKSDIEPVLNLWRQLDVTMNDRHPRSLKSVIGHVNAAVVMLELEGDQEVKVVRQEAKRLTIQALEELTTFFTSSFPPSVEIIDDADFQGGFTGFVFEDGQALLLVYLFQSCMTLLQRLQDYESLSQNSSVVMIIGFLDEILTSDERISLQGEFIGKDLKVLAADDIKAEVDATLKDFQQIRELELRRRDLARQIRLAAELQAAADAHAETPEEKLQRLRAERDASRVLRKLERIRLINARIKLYGMIQSDQIKPLFRLHTKNRAAVNSFGEKDPDIEDPLL